MKNSVGGVGFWPGVESSPAGPPGSMSDGMVKINVHLICPAKGRGQKKLIVRKERRERGGGRT